MPRVHMRDGIKTLCGCAARFKLLFTIPRKVVKIWSMKKSRKKFAVLLLVLQFGLGAAACRESENPGTQTETQGDTQHETDQLNNSEKEPDMPAADEALGVILEHGTRDFFRGYPVDEAFLCWVGAHYGQAALDELAQKLSEGTADESLWHDLTGNTMHVLYALYCRDAGFSTYLWEDIMWKTAADPECITIDLVGDINFDERWHTMRAAEAAGGVGACITEDVQNTLKSADITVLNHEFTYAKEDTPLAGKTYTFKSDPANVKLLDLFGVDLVSLANNHVCDYGVQGLLDTFETLEQAKIPYCGAGRNAGEASAVSYFVIGGRKIAVVSATEIERYSNYTKAATDTDPGVLRTQQEEAVAAAFREAKRRSDYVIAYIHWGAEGNLIRDDMQHSLANTYARAGADVVIGGHTHRLQGMAFINQVPVAYSLGNFWFSSGTLYTAIAQIQIDGEGELSLKMIPCIQRNEKTELLKTEVDIRAFYHYLADISTDIAIDGDGCVHSYTGAAGEAAEGYVYTSGQNYADHASDLDLEGRPIDIVGNLR